MEQIRTESSVRQSPEFYSELPGHLPATAEAKTHSAGASHFLPWVTALGNALRENLPILFIVAAYLTAAFVTQHSLGIPGIMQLRLNYPLFNFFAAGFFLVFFLTQLVAEAFGAGSLLWALREIHQRYFTRERMLGFLLVYLSIPPFMSTFRGFKEAIPWIHPFAWDEALAKVDYVLHFGNHPWALLQPLLGYPAITRTLDVFYMVWFPLLFGFALWMAWSDRRDLRIRFFVSFGFVWIVLGTILATLFSSAGPCYYSYVTYSADPFRPLMDYLTFVDEKNPLWALRNQRGIWDEYLVNAGNLPFGGISALPSIHLAMSALFALTAYRVNTWFGRALVIYMGINLLASVHLGWHYAVDGYAGMALTWLIWKATGRVLGQSA